MAPSETSEMSVNFIRNYNAMLTNSILQKVYRLSTEGRNLVIGATKLLQEASFYFRLSGNP